MPNQMEWDRFYIDQAVMISKYSKSRRLQVGAILVKDNRSVANSYNGTYKGLDNNYEEEIITYHTKDGLVSNVDNGGKRIVELITLPSVLHAEQNLVGFCARMGISMDNCTVYQTHSPCMSCCILLHACGIKRIVYLYEYRDPTAIEFCKKTGILMEKIDENPF